jgi:4-hydroxythreonine-4-phosphate dehydrogenase
MPALPLALTMGEPAGIGPEITLAAWARREAEEVPAFYAIADPRYLDTIAQTISAQVPLAIINDPAEATGAFAKGLPVLPIDLGADVQPGQPTVATAAAVINAIDTATGHALERRAGAVVTNPIHKSVLYDAGFHHPGHTEYLADLCAKFAGSMAITPIMMLAIPGLRVVPLTVHLALRQVAGALTRELIVDTGIGVARALRQDFACQSPRIAVAALNPHGGESGAMGREEIDIIAPAVAALKAQGVNAFGPHPADTLFHAAARQKYDAVLCMYHDQALIPLKTLDFDHGVNITLGLPIVRTSPDHGTALDIAGKGKASADSLIAALKTAAAIHLARKVQA